MSMMRNILGVRRDGYMKNEVIIAKCDQKPVSLKIRSLKVKWFRHIKRVVKEQIVCGSERVEMIGRPVGRP